VMGVAYREQGAQESAGGVQESAGA
jgi:hypothetical protein